MVLVADRDKMMNSYMKGDKPKGILEDYRDYRNSEHWRVSRAVEELCEYILYLEWELDQEKLKGSD